MENTGSSEIDCVRISSTSAKVRVSAEDRSDVSVDGTAPPTVTDSVATIRAGHKPVHVRVPDGTCVVVGTTSGRVDLAGSLGDVSVVTRSGKVTVEHARSLDVRTTSARVDTGSVEDECRVHSVSGTVTIGSCGGAEVSTRSGRIQLARVTGAAHVHCTSGRVTITMAEPADVDVRTISGSVDVSLPADARPFRTDDSSRTDDRPDDCNCTVHVHSISGKVTVT